MEQFFGISTANRREQNHEKGMIRTRRLLGPSASQPSVHKSINRGDAMRTPEIRQYQWDMVLVCIMLTFHEGYLVDKKRISAYHYRIFNNILQPIFWWIKARTIFESLNLMYDLRKGHNREDILSVAPCWQKNLPFWVFTWKSCPKSLSPGQG